MIELSFSPDPQASTVVNTRRTPVKRWFLLLAGLVLVLGYVSWHRGHAAQGAPPAMGGPTPVDVMEVQPHPTTIWTEFSAHTQPVDAAAIRPEVTGRITEINFRDGQNVKAGDVLFVIDPRPYEAALAKAQADLATAETNANFAQTELGRAQVMVATQAIARRLYDQRASDAKNTAAAVASAKAAVTQAALDVEYAHVKAPISGRVGRAEITVGNLVGAGPNAPVLTTIVSNDGIYADFDVDEQTYMKSVHSGAKDETQENAIPVELRITGDAKVYTGTIYSFDNHIDPSSGTIRARAKFANEDGALVPGMFVTVRLAGVQPETVLTVPEKAIGTDQDKKFVYVVGPENKVAYREVHLGDSVGVDRIVTTGLKAGDHVVVNGVQQVHPDAVIKPNMVTDANPPPAAMAPAAGDAAPAPTSDKPASEK